MDLDLAASMRTGIQRLNHRDRLLSSFKLKDYELSVTYTAEQSRILAANGAWDDVKDGTHGQKFPYFGKVWTETALKEAYRKCADQRLDDLWEAPPLLWSLLVSEQPQLDRGQHRRAALLRLISNTGIQLTPQAWKVSALIYRMNSYLC